MTPFPLSTLFAKSFFSDHLMRAQRRFCEKCQTCFQTHLFMLKVNVSDSDIAKTFGTYTSSERETLRTFSPRKTHEHLWHFLQKHNIYIYFHLFYFDGGASRVRWVYQMFVPRTKQNYRRKIRPLTHKF